MRRSPQVLAGLYVALALVLALVAPVFAQNKAPKTYRIDGRIVTISKNNSIMTVQSKNVRLQVQFDARTKFTYRNQPTTVSELKDGLRVICLVTTNDKNQMQATRIDLREK